MRLIPLSTALLCLSAATVSSADPVEAVNKYRAENEVAILKDFVELLAIPNFAYDVEDMQRNAEFITALLEPRGFETQTLSAGGAPYVYAELNTPGATETILLYAHFDGQAVQEENWAYPPFEPTLLDAPLGQGGEPIDIASAEAPLNPEARLYARSAGDDKMPVIAIVHVLDALREAGIELSVNLKLIFDGEEEQGSPTVGALLEKYGDLLDADFMLVCDGPMHQSRKTQLVFGVRGGINVDITTYGAKRPLHSGHYGNWAPNPIMQLSYLLTSLRDEAGYITIDGYYDDVIRPDELARAAIADMPDVTERLKDELAVHTPEGDGVRIEELVMLPALNARGIVAGGVGDKGRNIILSTATTALNLRLVPNQTPDRVRELVEAHIRKQGFYITYENPTDEERRNNEKVAKLEWRGAGNAGLRTPLSDPMAARLIRLMKSISPELIVTPSMGGGLPLHEFDAALGIPIIVLPLANHDNNQHAENENIRLQNFWDAMTIYGALLTKFGEAM